VSVPAWVTRDSTAALAVAFPPSDIRVEGHDAEPVARSKAVDDEAHGLLQQRQLVADHACTDVEYRHDI
jgi:hypothetical protein